nr:MAG TPA: hypothetical protein [Caudoviricetes sp.]
MSSTFCEFFEVFLDHICTFRILTAGAKIKLGGD